MNAAIISVRSTNKERNTYTKLCGAVRIKMNFNEKRDEKSYRYFRLGDGNKKKDEGTEEEKSSDL